MSLRGRSLTGVYVAPGAVVAAPDYAARLSSEAGVDVFLLRAGFDPAAPDPSLRDAIDIVRGLGAQAWLLIGTWWGRHVAVGAGCMAAPIEIPVSARGPAHEAQWLMHAPGGPADDLIAEALRRQCVAFAPDGVCLTHARYRHPADISGLFESGPGPLAAQAEGRGLAPESLAEDWRRACTRISRMQVAELEANAAALRLDRFLDMAAGTDAFTRWFELRAAVLESSIKRFGDIVRSASRGGIRFGVNAYGPHAAYLCGQDYRRLEGVVDFVQPLLGYVEWHVRQPVTAWAKLLSHLNPALEESDALRIAARMLGMADVSFGSSIAEAEVSGEGSAAVIQAIVEAQLSRFNGHAAGALDVLPVLRGSGWPPMTAVALGDEVRRRELGGLFYQGTEDLAGPAPVEGWA